MTDLHQRLARLSPAQRAALEERLLAESPPASSAIARRPPGSGPPPLSFGQERLWFLQRFDPADASYNLHLVEQLHGPLDVETLQAALGSVVARHEVLRTGFPMVDGRPLVHVEPRPEVAVEFTDLTDVAGAEQRRRAGILVAEAVNEPFRLEVARLLRVRLIRLAEQEHVFCLVLHHIVGDGWSLGVFASELSQCYAALRSGQPPVLAPLPVQYTDVAAWQRASHRERAQELDERIERLRRRLAGAPPLQLPTDNPRPELRHARGAAVSRRLGHELSAGIATLARTERATTFMAILAAYQVLLARHSGQDDFCVGTPITGRDRAELRSLIGFCTNTIVLRADLGGDPSFRELLGRVRAAALSAYADQDVPLERVIDGVDPGRDTSRTPLFQTMANLQPAKSGLLALPGVRADPWPVGGAQVKVDIELNANQHADGLELELCYDATLFDDATVEHMLAHLTNLVAAVVADPDASISRLPLIDEAERALLLSGWNDTAADYPAETVHELVAAQAAATPDAVAVIADGRSMSYRELDVRVGQVAGLLHDRGVAPQTPVGVLLPRGAELVAALLGVLKAGCYYLPLEPAHPAERQRQLIEDAGAASVLTDRELVGALPATVEAIHLDTVPTGDDHPASGPPMSPDTLAYVIYTSGSTGRPKGVRVPHRGVVNLVADVTRTLRLTAADRFLFLTSVSFDIAALELFAPLLTGGAVVVAGQSSVYAADEVGRLIEHGGVTTLQAPPTVLEALLTAMPAAPARVISGGEPLPAALAERLLAWAGEVWNFYGPTETTIWSCRSRVRPATAISIGAPVANTEAYVLDERLQPAPLGCVGELYLAGDGVARDYHGSPSLTAGHFVPDPYGRRPGSRMYRTGDRVRRRSDGQLQFLGRADHQVKVGGMRIELGEVEAALAGHPAVRRAAVTVRDDGLAGPSGRRLIGYVDWTSGPADAATALRLYLSTRLPAAMIPDAFVVITDFPVLPSGKLDRAALPAPAAEPAGAPYRPPATDSERLVADVFAEVLARDRVGAADDFFAIGGNSLLAVKATAELSAVTELDVPLRLLFTQRTVDRLAAAVEELLVADIDRLSDDEAAQLAAGTRRA